MSPAFQLPVEHKGTASHTKEFTHKLEPFTFCRSTANCCGDNTVLHSYLNQICSVLLYDGCVQNCTIVQLHTSSDFLDALIASFWVEEIARKPSLFGNILRFKSPAAVPTLNAPDFLTEATANKDKTSIFMNFSSDLYQHKL
jgi:hypothetical protein